MPRARQLAKDALWWLNVRTLYSRITLTRYTTCYFFLALLHCVIQVAMETATLSDNIQGIQVMSTILAEAKVPRGFPVIQNNSLQICNSIPGQSGTECFTVSGQQPANVTFNFLKEDVIDQSESDSLLDRRAISGQAEFDTSGNLKSVRISDGITPPITLSNQCVVSLSWLNDILRDARREDAVTLAFQVWLLGLSIVAILNESIPHLFAVLASHVLDTIWAGARMSTNSDVRSLYEQFIVKDSCGGLDFNKALWDARMSNSTVVIIVNCVVFAGLVYLSSKLFKVYEARTVKYFGASARLTRVYKFVLVLSIFLQIAGFFLIASTALWIDKVTSGAIRDRARHLTLYQIGFIITAILEIPWLVLGWISVRREKRNLFIIFSLIGVLLVGISSAMFASTLYRYVFNTWRFFAVMTIAAYILLVVTSILGVLCRLQFGNGLVEYLKTDKKTDNLDFDPVHAIDDSKEGLRNAAMPPLLADYYENGGVASINAPPQAAMNDHNSSHYVKAVLRRLSGKSRPPEESIADGASSQRKPVHSTFTLDNIISSYGDSTPQAGRNLSFPNSKYPASASPIPPTPIPPTPETSFLPPIKSRGTSRWSLSAYTQDLVQPPPAVNPAVAEEKKASLGLPSNPKPWGYI